eukprot:jgi/Chlat1/5477/Chrsp36S05457
MRITVVIYSRQLAVRPTDPHQTGARSTKPGRPSWRQAAVAAVALAAAGLTSSATTTCEITQTRVIELSIRGRFTPVPGLWEADDCQ